MDTSNHQLLIELMELSQDIGRFAPGAPDSVYEKRAEVVTEVLKRMEAHSG
jgi:hypothetical protein